MKVAVVTGTRAEYGLLHPVLTEIQKHKDLNLLLVVTGMHLSHEFGLTLQEIVKDGFKIDAKVDMLLSSDTPSSMAKCIGIGVMGMAQTWEQLKPDIVVVLGDRVEPLAATIAAAYMNIPVAHIHGGDISGGVDNSARHAITKFAHIHFPVTKKSAQRLILMGEEEWRVHMVGSPVLDGIVPRSKQPELSEPLILIVQHPVANQDGAEQMRITLEAIKELGYPTIVFYPNSDSGGREMIEVIQEFEGSAFLMTFKSLPRKDYLKLMGRASVLVGNSSSGILEAPSFGLPVVNIGIRQQGRERGANVIDVAHDKVEITNAVQKALTDKKLSAEVRKCRNPYGDGKASERIVGVLSKLEITPQLLQKVLTYG